MKRKVHNYTSEMELKSLLIRIKNERAGIQDKRFNSRINRYIGVYNKLQELKYGEQVKSVQRSRILTDLKDKIISLSESTAIDKVSYEKFGDIILLMIKKILTKPSFSGYTYRDDFYSDATYKILKYLYNFDHTLISERSGQPVNAFAYISQIIHNSIICIINTRNKENDEIKKLAEDEMITKNIIKKSLMNDHNEFDSPQEKCDKHFYLNIEYGVTDRIEEILNSIDNNNFNKVIFHYPETFYPTIDDYATFNEFKRIYGNVIVTGEKQ